MQLSPYLYGIHDPGGEHLMERAKTKGWILFHHGLGHDPSHMSGFDYSRWADQGYTAIARLNHGYGKAGTIPLPEHYAAFAARVRNWVRASKGCHVWIVGNEPNHQQERPDGNHIYPWDYARCFVLARKAIRLVSGHEQDIVLPAAVAPWNNTTPYQGNERGDWVLYLLDVFAHIKEFGGAADGINLHAYTHGHSAKLVTDNSVMGAPFTDRRYHLRAYLDFLEALPTEYDQLPVYITELDADDAWENINNGWVQAAYKEFDRYNRASSRHQIRCAILYRWGTDRWDFSRKGGVQEDFAEAMKQGYRWQQSEPDIGQAPTCQLVVVAGYVVNVRRSPGFRSKKGSDVVCQVTYGDALVVTGPARAEDGLRWWPVCIEKGCQPPACGWIAEATPGGMRLIVPGEMSQITIPRLKLPFDAPVRLTQGWGANPGFYGRYSYRNIKLLGHNGLDFGLSKGTPLYAVMDGTVARSRFDRGFGNYVVVSSTWGEVLCAHMDRRQAKEGAQVKAHEVIGYSGNTGASSGPHLHLALRIRPYRVTDGWGGYCNPTNFFDFDNS